MTQHMGIRVRRLASAALLACAALVGAAMPATAQSGSDAAKVVKWKGVALQRTSLQWTEKWMWLKDELARRTKDRLQLDVVSFPELGMTGPELIRVLNSNLVDIADVVTGYVSGEVPLFEGAQLPGIYADYAQARKGYDAWGAAVVSGREKQIGGKVIGSFAFSSQYLWTKNPINSLDDLKGKKIRIFSKAQADYLSALGAEPVSIPLADLYTAIERGAVDGAVTGPEWATGVKLWEIVGYVTDLRLAVGGGYVVVSRRAWDALPADMRAVLEELAPEVTQRGWDLGARDTTAGIDLALKNGIKATIPAKPEWQPTLAKIAREVVVPGWAKRSGPDALALFNKNLAPISGFTVE